MQVKGIPFLAFDAGGVLEMFNGKVHTANVVLEPTLAALTAKLTEVPSSFHPPIGCSSVSRHSLMQPWACIALHCIVTQ